MRIAALIAAALSALATACATQRPLPGRNEVGSPEEERSLMRTADEAEAELQRSGRLLQAPDVDRYLAEIAGRMVPSSPAAATFRLRVIRERLPTAFALANGAIYATTGLLALLQGEGELAMVLGHEMAHVTRRHPSRQLLASRRTGGIRVYLAAPGVGSAARALVAMRSVSEYGRDLELEADREGLALVRVAGYQLTEAVQALRRFEGFAATEKLGEDSGPWASHPLFGERIEALGREEGAAPGREPTPAPEEYDRRVAPALAENLRIEMAAGRYAPARALAVRYAEHLPDDAGGHLALGEIARREGTAEGARVAADAYRRAVSLDSRCAGAWRGLGLLALRKDDRAAAEEAFSRYIELAPGAPDVAHIRATLARGPREGP